MRGKVGQVALLAVGLGAIGWCSARLIALVASIALYLGWGWLIALGGGVALTVAPIWALGYGFRKPASWARWLLLGYTAALIFGMYYYLPRRFTPPGAGQPDQPVPAPPLSFDLQVAGLLTITAIVVTVTLLLLLTAAETIAPGRVKPVLRAILRRPPNPAA